MVSFLHQWYRSVAFNSRQGHEDLNSIGWKKSPVAAGESMDIVAEPILFDGELPTVGRVDLYMCRIYFL